MIRLTPSADPIRLDPAAGTVTVDAGVSLDSLLRVIVPQGWFVPVSPGTRFVTVGGAIASDIHGKGHHVDGSFGSHVTEMEMLLADGGHALVTAAIRSGPVVVDDRRHGPDRDHPAGHVRADRHRDAAHARRHRTGADTSTPCSNGWSRATTGTATRSPGSTWWRPVRTSADRCCRAGTTRRSTNCASSGPRAARQPLVFDPPTIPDVPPGLPNMVIPLTVRPFNELWYRKAPKQHHGVETVTAFFHPLDMVGKWNRFYGRNGFLQYQFVVPFEAVDTLRTIVRKISDEGHASPLTVLKRMGAESGGLLSFPTPGWTLTVDLAAGDGGLPRLVRDLDDLVLAAGGRHYLAKDSHATPEVIRAGYPRLDEWKSIRYRFDPDGLWASDQARRLDLL